MVDEKSMKREEEDEKEEDGKIQVHDFFLIFVLHRCIERLIEGREDALEYMSITRMEECPPRRLRNLLEHILIDISSEFFSFLIVEIFSFSFGSYIRENCAR